MSPPETLIVALARLGYGGRETAKLLRMSPQLVQYYRDKWGIKVRKPRNEKQLLASITNKKVRKAVDTFRDVQDALKAAARN